MKPLLAFILVFASSILGIAQAPFLEWQTFLGGTTGEYLQSIVKGVDGGYLFAANIEGPDNNDIMGYHGNPVVGDIWLVKLDDAGKLEWQKSIGGTYRDVYPYITQTDDGYMVVANSSSIDCMADSTNGWSNIWVLRLDKKGNILWQKSFGGSQTEYATGISRSSDGFYYISAHTNSKDGDITSFQGAEDGWLLKIDGNGTLIWQKSLGSTGQDRFTDLVANSDGGCTVSGYAANNSGNITGHKGRTDFWVVRFDKNGNVLWNKCYGGSADDIPHSLTIHPGGGFAVAGQTGSDDGDVSGKYGGAIPFSDFWVTRIDDQGNLVWQKCYGGNSNEIGYVIKPMPGGGFVVAGNAYSTDGDVGCNRGLSDQWIIKIDDTGNLLKTQVIGGSYFDEVYDVIALASDNIIVASVTCSPEIKKYPQNANPNFTCADIWIYKLNMSPDPATKRRIIISPADARICEGNRSTFSAEIENGGVLNRFQWIKNGVSTGQTGKVFTAAGLINGDVLECEVYIDPLCGGDPVSVSEKITVRTLNYPLQPSVSIVADNTDACGCNTISMEAKVENAGPSPVYQWYVNNQTEGANRNVFMSSSLKAGDVIYCGYYDNSICGTLEFKLSNKITIGLAGSPPTISIKADTNNVCAGTTINFSAQANNAGAAPVYQWRINNVPVGITGSLFSAAGLSQNDKVSCLVKKAPGTACGGVDSALSNTVVAIVQPVTTPVVSIVASFNPVCTGQSVTYRANVINAGTNPRFTWLVNGVSMPVNSDTLLLTNPNDRDSIQCLVKVDAGLTCSRLDSVISNTLVQNVLVNPVPVITIQASDTAICKNETVVFNANYSNAGAAPLIEWLVNGQVVLSGSAIFSTASLSRGDFTQGRLKSDLTGCQAGQVLSNILSIIVSEPPVVSISPVDTFISKGISVTLSAITAGPVSGYAWMPSSYLLSTNGPGVVTVPLDTSTVFSVEVVNEAGCNASASTTVYIRYPLLMPSAFTPNADGLNDFFRIPPNVNFTLQEFSVFNRWGQLVFSSRDRQKGWDGTFRNQPSPAGAYSFIVKGTDERGQLQQSGTFMLVR